VTAVPKGHKKGRQRGKGKTSYIKNLGGGEGTISIEGVRTSRFQSQEKGRSF